MEGLKFTFEKGGIIYARLFDLTAESKKSLLDILPVETKILHTRWCGREIYANITTRIKPPKENLTTIVSKFDMVYWRKWDIDGSEQYRQEETISLFYGPELLMYHGGLLQVKIIGRVEVYQESLLEDIGNRIWQSGSESVKIEKHFFYDE